MIKNGYYKGIIKSIEVKEFSKRDDPKIKFKKIELMCQIMIDNNEVKMLKCSYSIDGARKLFVGSGVSTNSCVGKKILGYVGKKTIITEEGGTASFNILKHILFVNDKGEIIYNPYEEEESNNETGLDF